MGRSLKEFPGRDAKKKGPGGDKPFRGLLLLGFMCWHNYWTWPGLKKANGSTHSPIPAQLGFIGDLACTRGFSRSIEGGLAVNPWDAWLHLSGSLPCPRASSL